MNAKRIFLASAALMLAGAIAFAQSDSDVQARIWLNKGEKRVLDGYLRSALVNRPDHIEFSLTPDGERTRYINEDVDSLLLEGSDKYVKRLLKVYGLFGGAPSVEWVREEYKGKGIDLYSLFTVESEKINNVTIVRPLRGWYLSIADDMAIMMGTDTRDNLFDRTEPSMASRMLEEYFGKIYDYPEFAARIKAGEFETFMDVIRAWEASYGGTARRSEGKFKADQISVQSGIAAADALKDMDWKRTSTEIVFPKYTRTLQVGVSPVVAPWARVMKHAVDGDESSFKMEVPPVMVYSDICFMDFGRFGSIGWTVGGEFSRYSYSWMLDDGYGDEQMDTFCNRIDLGAGLSYHLTLCRRLEFYARAMVDIGIIGEHTTEHESGEEASSTFNKMDNRMGVLATAGLRWYFSEKAGIWVEGGHDTGFVSAGLSYKF